MSRLCVSLVVALGFVSAYSFAQVAPAAEESEQSSSAALLFSLDQTDGSCIASGSEAAGGGTAAETAVAAPLSDSAASSQALATSPAAPQALDGEEGGGENLYSSPEMRTEWEAMLAQECAGSDGLEAFWDPTMGNLAALSAECPMVATDADSAAAWLRSHDQMIGLLPEDELVLAAGGTSDFILPADDGEGDPVVAGVSHNFTVRHEGLPYLDGSILANLSDSAGVLFGVANTLAPPVGGFGEHIECPVEDATKAFQSQLPPEMSMTLVDSELGWFDPDWAIGRRVGTEDVHWRITLASAEGWSGTAYVRCAGNEVTLMTNSGESNFIPPPPPPYDPKQQHFVEYYVTRTNNSGVVAWENYTGGNMYGCNSPTDKPWCANPVYSESLISRNIAAQVPSTLYNLSNSIGWPFAKKITAPIACNAVSACEDWYRIAIVADPMRIDRCNLYPCTPMNSSSTQFERGQITYPTVGHEYAHIFIQDGALDNRSYVNNEPRSPADYKAWAFDEAVCDFFGFVFEQAATGSTSFKVTIPRRNGAEKWTVDWTNDPGDCKTVTHARIRLGAALYDAFGSIRAQYHGLDPSVPYIKWRLTVASALKAVSGVPNFVKFYSAAHARMMSSWTCPDAVSCPDPRRLVQALEAHGIPTCL